MEHDLSALIARLLAHHAIPRSDPQARRALTDEAFRADLEARLAACGLELLENPYASHIAVAVRREVEDTVFGQGEHWLSNTMGLPRDAVALLVVIWALIILPKRERQISRQATPEGRQNDMFADAKPIPMGRDVVRGLPELTFYADFGAKLCGRGRFNIHLGALARLGFIERRMDNGLRMIEEGPMLDVLLDYHTLAPRILQGALADLLAQEARFAALNPSLFVDDEEAAEDLD